MKNKIRYIRIVEGKKLPQGKSTSRDIAWVLVEAQEICTLHTCEAVVMQWDRRIAYKVKADGSYSAIFVERGSEGEVLRQPADD